MASCYHSSILGLCVSVCAVCVCVWCVNTERDKVICHLWFHMSGIEIDDKSMRCVSVCGFIFTGTRASDVMHENVFVKPAMPLQTPTLC